jgi:hypothetical protein
MKKILFVVLAIMSSLNAESGMTDIYTGNGINTSADSAIANMVELRKTLTHKTRDDLKLNIDDEGEKYQFKYVYNPSYGYRDDVLETYYQLKESGQISRGYFASVFIFATWNLGYRGILKKYKAIVDTYKQDTKIMYNAYMNSSFNKNNNVLLVSHSQGSLMANKLYGMLNSAQKNKYHSVAVAPAANHISGYRSSKEHYVTMYGDYGVFLVKGHLRPNTSGFGHGFVSSYLSQSKSRTKISKYIKKAYDDFASRKID